MLARDFFGLLLRRLHVAFAAGALLLLEPALRLAQLPERRASLPCAARITGRCRAPHGVGGLPRGLSGLREIGTITLARQPLELSRRLFGLFGERALARAAALAALPGERLLPLALRFLLLPAGQLAQLFHQCVDLLIRLLLLRALRGFVLVCELVEILLEELGEIFLNRSGATAAATTASALLADLLLVFFLGPLQLRERAVLGLKCVRRSLCLQLSFGGAHLFNRFRQELRDAQKRRVRLDQPAVHAAHEALDLLAQLRLRQRDDDEALTQLRRRHRLAVANDVVRGRNNLALLLRERIDLHVAAAATTAASAAAHRHGGAELLVELADPDEIEVARYVASDVVGRAREIRNGVSRRDLQLLEIERVRG